MPLQIAPSQSAKVFQSRPSISSYDRFVYSLPPSVSQLEDTDSSFEVGLEGVFQSRHKGPDQALLFLPRRIIYGLDECG